MYGYKYKSIFDFIIAILLLLAISPVFTLIIIILKLSSKEKVFFIHPRPGLNEKIIYIMKFRTMSNKKDKNGILIPNYRRITKIGSFLRKTSLDEIPQLINVLKGEISIIGPRPLEVRYLPYYSESQRSRHFVKPGITGLAQVKGRNSISWEEKFKYDVYYVNNVTFVLDLKILFLTIIKVFKEEGINIDSYNTTIPFDEYIKWKNNEKINI